MNIPFYNQETKWTCGAAAFRMALEAFGIKRSEKIVVKLLKTSKIKGTYHRDFSRVAERFKFNHLTLRNAKIEDIKYLLKNKWVVIVNNFDMIQNFGHYIIITKLDKEFIYFHDPWFKDGQNRKIAIKDFEEVWFDSESERGWLFAMRKIEY